MDSEVRQARSAALFGALAEPYLSLPDVRSGTGFGGNQGLRRAGKVFAMIVEGSLVVKLPRDHAEAVVAAGHATPFDPGHGRLMREWIAVSVDRPDDWAMLVAQAFRNLGHGQR